MRSKPSSISRSILVGFAIFALSGCAQFQDSFGEITDPDRSPSEYAASNPDSAARNPSDTRSYRSLTYGGVKVQLGQGELID